MLLATTSLMSDRYTASIVTYQPLLRLQVRAPAEKMNDIDDDRL